MIAFDDLILTVPVAAISFLIEKEDATSVSVVVSNGVVLYEAVEDVTAPADDVLTSQATDEGFVVMDGYRYDKSYTEVIVGDVSDEAIIDDSAACATQPGALPDSGFSDGDLQAGVLRYETSPDLWAYYLRVLQNADCYELTSDSTLSAPNHRFLSDNGIVWIANSDYANAVLTFDSQAQTFEYSTEDSGYLNNTPAPDPVTSCTESISETLQDLPPVEADHTRIGWPRFTISWNAIVSYQEVHTTNETINGVPPDEVTWAHMLWPRPVPDDYSFTAVGGPRPAWVEAVTGFDARHCGVTGCSGRLDFDFSGSGIIAFGDAIDPSDGSLYKIAKIDPTVVPTRAHVPPGFEVTGNKIVSLSSGDITDYYATERAEQRQEVVYDSGYIENSTAGYFSEKVYELKPLYHTVDYQIISSTYVDQTISERAYRCGPTYIDWYNDSFEGDYVYNIESFTDVYIPDGVCIAAILWRNEARWELGQPAYRVSYALYFNNSLIDRFYVLEYRYSTGQNDGPTRSPSHAIDKDGNHFLYIEMEEDAVSVPRAWILSPTGEILKNYADITSDLDTPSISGVRLGLV